MVLCFGEFFFGEKQAQKGGVNVGVDSPKYDGMSQSEAYLILHEANFHAGKAFDGYYCCGDSNHKGKGSLLLVDLDEALPHGVVVQVGAKASAVGRVDLWFDADTKRLWMWYTSCPADEPDNYGSGCGVISSAVAPSPHGPWTRLGAVLCPPKFGSYCKGGPPAPPPRFS